MRVSRIISWGQVLETEKKTEDSAWMCSERGA